MKIRIIPIKNYDHQGIPMTAKQAKELRGKIQVIVEKYAVTD